MTCIVGLVDNGKVWMGGDSAGSNGWDLNTLAHSKIIKKEEMLIGVTGYLRGLQLMQYKEWIPKYREDEDDSILGYLCSKFVDALKKLFYDNNYSQRDNNQDSNNNDSYLVGWKGRLFIIESNYQILEFAEKYTAIGCGKKEAIGSLYAHNSMNPDSAYTPGYMIEEALKVSEKYNEGVRSPFIIESV